MIDIKICFYKGFKGTFLDKMISLFTFSKYSHCELLLSDGYSYSSSNRDGGVRRKIIDYDPDKWDIFNLEVISEKYIYIFYNHTNRCSYDYISIFINFILPFFRISTGTQYYCSEWVSTALSKVMEESPFKSFQITPGKLFKLLRNNNYLY